MAAPSTLSPRRPRFSASVALTYSTSVAQSTLQLGSVLITARALGPSGRGELVFLMTVAGLTSFLATLGIEEATANLAGSQAELRATVATNALLLSGLLGLVSIGIVASLIAIDPGIGGHAQPLLRWLTLGVIPVLIFQLALQYLLRADYAFGAANFAPLIMATVNVSVNGLLFALGLITVESALITWISGQILTTGFLAWYVGRRRTGFGRPDRALAGQMLGFGVKAHASRVMMSGNYRLDQWILGAIAPARELGLYSVAVAWSETLFFLPDALSLVLRPDLIRASSREAGQQAAVVFRVAVLLTLPLVLVMIAAAPVLCVTFFGSAFHGSIVELRVLVPGVFGMLAIKVMANALIAQRRPLLNNVAIGIAFALTVGLDVLLIPSHGGLGAAVASTVAYVGGGVAMVLIFRRTLGVKLVELLPRRSDMARLLRSLSWVRWPRQEVGAG